MRDNFTFFGLINKVDYIFKIGTFDIRPKIKNELRIETPVLKTSPKRQEDIILMILLARWPLLNLSSIEAGVEYTIFQQLRDSDQAVREGLDDDFTEIVGAAQFSNTSNYLGYSLTTQMGFRLSRRNIGGEDTETGRVAFATVYAGFE